MKVRGRKCGNVCEGARRAPLPLPLFSFLQLQVLALQALSLLCCGGLLEPLWLSGGFALSEAALLPLLPLQPLSLRALS